METDIAVGGSTDELFRAAMVDRLRDHGLAGPARVEAAIRAAPRHLLIPDVTVERAYAQEAVVTRRDAAGVAVSSAPAPGVVAGMLGQLDVRPGHRVLEIGAGPGYTAALLAHLAGPEGTVTTVDIDPDVASAARRAFRRGLRGRRGGGLRRWRVRLPGSRAV